VRAPATMRVARTIAELRAARAALPAPVGLVPTMGALHEGHLSLVRRAHEQCASVVASLFVNPTQFGPNEDLARYPRDEQRDARLFAETGADLLFAPGVEEIYPPGHTTAVSVSRLSERLEGGHRPGHLEGVATVVTVLLSIVAPDRAYFGEKDAQQLAVIRRLVRDLALPVEVVGCTTVRDRDGLALSSRNVYLSAEERRQALALSAGLAAAGAAFEDGVRDAETLRRIVRDRVEAQPLAAPDYISLADAETLEELDGELRGDALLSLAVRVGTTRLIDNMTLRP
jgi:pantoate--beta-alanine ligase